MCEDYFAFPYKFLDYINIVNMLPWSWSVVREMRDLLWQVNELDKVAKVPTRRLLAAAY